MKLSVHHDHTSYRMQFCVKGKNLSQLWNRAALVIQAVGNEDIFVEHLPPKRGKKKHELWISVV